VIDSPRRTIAVLAVANCILGPLQSRLRYCWHYPQFRLQNKKWPTAAVVQRPANAEGRRYIPAFPSRRMVGWTNE